MKLSDSNKAYFKAQAKATSTPQGQYLVQLQLRTSLLNEIKTSPVGSGPYMDRVKALHGVIRNLDLLKLTLDPQTIEAIEDGYFGN